MANNTKIHRSKVTEYRFCVAQFQGLMRWRHLSSCRGLVPCEHSFGWFIISSRISNLCNLLLACCLTNDQRKKVPYLKEYSILGQKFQQHFNKQLGLKKMAISV